MGQVQRTVNPALIFIRHSSRAVQLDLIKEDPVQTDDPPHEALVSIGVTANRNGVLKPRPGWQIRQTVREVGVRPHHQTRLGPATGVAMRPSAHVTLLDGKVLRRVMNRPAGFQCQQAVQALASHNLGAVPPGGTPLFALGITFARA
jgi:hypothetical protein